jgi:hypothetical protein
VGLAIPLAAALRLRANPAAWRIRLCLLVVAVYSGYIVIVGGDVLRMHRFFVPVLLFFYFVLSEGLWLLPHARWFAPPALIAAALLTFWGPFSPGNAELLQLRGSSRAERILTNTMGATGVCLNAHTRPDDWIACTTIGAIGYFSDRNQIDMLGLTDAVVARAPESILGGGVYWRESRYNTRHVLERLPSYICFSTGHKPSASAERALFLRARFRRGYFTCPISQVVGDSIITYMMYKVRPGADTIPIETPGIEPRFVDDYSTGTHFAWAGWYDSAVVALQRCCRLSPPDFAGGLEELGHTFYRMQRFDSAKLYLQKALAVDEWNVFSYVALGQVFAAEESYDSTANELRKALAYDPDWFTLYAGLSGALVLSHRFREAESVMAVCVSKFPGAAEPVSRLAAVRLLRADSEVAH